MILIFFAFRVSKSWITSGPCYNVEIYSQIPSLRSIQYFLLYMFKQFMASMYIYLICFNVLSDKIITVSSCLQNKLFAYDLY